MGADRERELLPSPRDLRGRAEELAAISARMNEGGRLLTLRGPPGVGKTALARAVVHRLSREGRRVRFASLARLDTRGAALAAIARAIGLSPRTANDAVVLERIVRQLDEGSLQLDEGSRTTLVLDEVDALRAEARSIVEDLLGEAADLSILVCARAPLGSPLEEVLALAPLPPRAATELLVDRAHQAAPERAIEPELAERLALRSGGLPLAIEIVAGWVAALGARETLAALSEGALALDALDHALDASWTLLGPAERGSFAALSVFRGSFDLEAARAVAASPQAAAHLATLVSASLVDVHDTIDGARYEMLEGVRAYASKKAKEEPAEQLDARARLARHLAAAARPRADLPSSWRRLAEERDDLVGAWEHAIDGDPRMALRLAVVLEPSLAAQGPPALHRKILERSIAASEAASLPDLGREHAAATIDLLFALGRLESLRGYHAASRAPFERGIALAERGSDGVRTAWLLAHLSRSLSALGRVEDAASLVARAREVCGRETDARLQATVEHALGGLHLASGQLDAAGEAYRRASSAARAAGAPRLEGVALLGSCRVHLARAGEANVEAAASTFAEARARFEVATDAFHLARLTAYEGGVALVRGNVDEAEERFARALDEVVLQDDIEGELEARLGLTLTAHARGDVRLAERRLDDFDLAARRTDDLGWGPRRAAAERTSSEAAPAASALTLALSRDGRSLELCSRAVDFGRRGPLRRILVALAERHHESPGRAMSVSEIRAAGWPDEKMLHESGTARVYMAIRRLRTLGLDPLLRTSDEGYALDTSVTVIWRDPA
ncbi:MAG: AAA family ATPase [Labilithrix sp.]|nr:AAA family ATPase [Labilithrix sp.]